MYMNLKAISAAFALAAVLSCTNKNDRVEGTRTLTDNNITLTWIQDNAQDRLMELTLFPDASDSLIASLGLQNGIPSSVSVFLADIGGKKILFDTGLGMPGCRMLPSMEALGVNPENVDYLYLTHFHGDHIGGMLKDGQPVFPNAQVYASRKEYDAWMAMPDDRKAQVVETMDAYRDRLHLFTPGDTIPCGVVTADAPGHTPGHTVYKFGKFIVVGDLMHGVALQKPHPEICAAYDMDFPTAVSTRKAVLKYAADNHLVMAGMHFPVPAFIEPAE